MKVVIVGGGPSGMLAAISAAQNSNNVIILERNKFLGKKILVTGKGRCNVTSSIAIEDFIKNIPGNGKFLYSCFQNFTNQDIVNLLEANGVKLKEERGNRYFPVSDRAEDVRACLENEIKKYKNIQIKTNSRVSKILSENGEVIGVQLESGEKIMASKVIVATGGNSYTGTGSTGDGYKMAKEVRTYYRENKRISCSTYFKK